MARFKDRQEGGRLLARRLAELGIVSDLVVAIPRGGVVTGEIVAKSLGWPLEVIVTKKLGAPGEAELAIGAIAEEGKAVLDTGLTDRLGVKGRYLEIEKKRVREKIRVYVEKFRQGRRLVVANKTVVVVDDGVATGATMEAAVRWLREQGAAQVIVATPVCSVEADERLSQIADQIVCLEVSEMFGAVGQFYEDFPQVTDEEVMSILKARTRKFDKAKTGLI